MSLPLFADDTLWLDEVKKKSCCTAGSKELEVKAFTVKKGTPLSISSTCAVFAESEIIGLLGNGHSVEDIVSGVHYSIAKRIVKLVKRVGVKENVYFDGGPAMNGGLVKAIENELGHKIYVPKHPQITTSYGAAVLACDAFLSEAES